MPYSGKSGFTESLHAKPLGSHLENSMEADKRHCLSEAEMTRSLQFTVAFFPQQLYCALGLCDIGG